jgi:autotransporter-associated beta strand protein
MGGWAGSRADAADVTWTGGGTSSSWADGGNWSPIGAPGTTNGAAGTSTDTAIFNSPQAGDPITTLVDVDVNRNIGSLRFESTLAKNISLGTTTAISSSSTLYLSGGGQAQQLGGANGDFYYPVALNGDYTFVSTTSGGQSLRFFGGVRAATPGNHVLTLDGTHGSTGSAQTELDGPITDGAGVISIVKNGTGTWEVNADATSANTYSGDTVVNAGFLRVSTATGYNGVGGFSANSHYTVNNGGTIRVSVIGATMKQLTLKFGSAITASSPSTQILNLKNDSGPGLELDYTDSTNSGDLTFAGVPFSFIGTVPDQGGLKLLVTPTTGRVSVGQTTSPVNLGPVRRVIDVGDGVGTDYDLRFRGSVSGTAGFLKKGPGILRFEATSNPVTGLFEIQEGGFNAQANNSLTGSPAPGLLLTGGDLIMQSGTNQTFDTLTVNKGNINGGNTTSTTTVTAPGYNFLIGSGDTASVASGITLPDIGSGTSSLLKSGDGSVTLSGIMAYTGATTVNGGTLSLATDLTKTSGLTVTAGKVELRVTGAPNRVIRAPILNISGTGKVDLKHNHLITNAPVGTASGSVYSGVSGYIQSGRGTGSWNGTTGIVTSMSDATSGSFTSIGIATAQQVKLLANPGDTAVWSGQTVTGTDTLVMYTYGGDANLDGKLNVDDYSRIDSNIGLGTAGWYNGDFNYDGKVNVDDYGILDSNIGIQGPQFPSAPGEAAPAATLSAVPEPSGAALLAASLIAARRRRRRGCTSA